MENKIVLYSLPTCGVCNMIKAALKNAGIEFNINQDIEYMRSQGIFSLPLLDVNGDKMNAQEAMHWINGRNKKI